MFPFVSHGVSTPVIYTVVSCVSLSWVWIPPVNAYVIFYHGLSESTKYAVPINLCHEEQEILILDLQPPDANYLILLYPVIFT